jgi:hypothetical protein
MRRHEPTAQAKRADTGRNEPTRADPDLQGLSDIGPRIGGSTETQKTESETPAEAET